MHSDKMITQGVHILFVRGVHVLLRLIFSENGVGSGIIRHIPPFPTNGGFSVVGAKAKPTGTGVANHFSKFKNGL